MARKRSIIKSMVRRALYQLEGRFKVCYVSREEVGEKLVCVPGGRIVHSDSWAIYLEDDTAIPYHRIVEIRDETGRLLWSRSSGLWNKNNSSVQDRK
ncbi:MAG: RNA repair domain-containing protein [Desulfurococcales archaeon]|nr:RNA repair domain-containing protein [Desulfurococcales archaeon]